MSPLEWLSDKELGRIAGIGPSPLRARSALGSELMTISRHLSIHGRVQGVFYRASAHKAARSLGLVGWVRNRRDGTVEAFVQGEPDAVERFIAWAWNGPAHAKVDQVDVSEVGVQSGLVGFAQLRTG